jgi:regulator of G-protein signaling
MRSLATSAHLSQSLISLSSYTINLSFSISAPHPKSIFQNRSKIPCASPKDKNKSIFSNYTNKLKKKAKKTSCTTVEEQQTTTAITAHDLELWVEKFEYLMENEQGRRLFKEFLVQEYSEENLLFWTEVEKLKDLLYDDEAYRKKSKDVYAEFVESMAPKEINISGTTRRKIAEELENDDTTENLFKIAQHEVYVLMRRQSYPRFLVSDLFKKLQQSVK